MVLCGRDKIRDHIRCHVEEIGPQRCDKSLNDIDALESNSPSAKQMLQGIRSNSIEAHRSQRCSKYHNYTRARIRSV
jgi:hypothetical protein